MQELRAAMPLIVATQSGGCVKCLTVWRLCEMQVFCSAFCVRSSRIQCVRRRPGRPRPLTSAAWIGGMKATEANCRTCSARAKHCSPQRCCRKQSPTQVLYCPVPTSSSASAALRSRLVGQSFKSVQCVQRSTPTSNNCVSLLPPPLSGMVRCGILGQGGEFQGLTTG